MLSVAEIVDLLAKGDPIAVRPYVDREIHVKGAKRPFVERKYHSLVHLELGGKLVCGFDDYEGLEADGSPGPGWEAHACDDCAEIVNEIEKGA